MDQAKLLLALIRKPGCAFYLDGTPGNIQLVESLPKNCDYDTQFFNEEAEDFIDIAIDFGFKPGDKIWIEFEFQPDWYEENRLVARGGLFPDRINVELSKVLNLDVDFDETILKLM